MLEVMRQSLPYPKSILLGEEDRVALIEIPSGRERTTYAVLAHRALRAEVNVMRDVGIPFSPPGFSLPVLGN
jgi:hypothetical protein